jgi:hypothetical protein
MKIFEVSSKTGAGMDELLQSLAEEYPMKFNHRDTEAQLGVS